MGNCLCRPFAALHAWLFTPVKVFAVNHRRLKSLRVLGEGGFARVYLVQDMKSKRLFALKTVLCSGPGDLEDVLWEVGVHRTLTHCGLQGLVDYCIAQHPSGCQQVLMLLPYFARGTLADELRVARGAAAPGAAAAAFEDEPAVLDLVERVALALRELHHHEPAWAHRDVKCENILISDTGAPVLTDFGSVAISPVAVSSTDHARRLQEAINTRTSPLYRAPELFDVQPGQIVDEKCDVWALGCVAWAAAFGRPPFEAEIERGGVPALSVLSEPAVPRDHGRSEALVALIRRLMAIGPDDRPNIDQVIEAIGHVRASHRDAGGEGGGRSVVGSGGGGGDSNGGASAGGKSEFSGASAGQGQVLIDMGGPAPVAAAQVHETHDFDAAFHEEEEQQQQQRAATRGQDGGDSGGGDPGGGRGSLLSPALISDDNEMTSLVGS
jgi:serine/threonine kinase 16